jgi:hypothetical protein
MVVQRRRRWSLALLIFGATAAALSSDDACATRTDDVPCLRVGNCGRSDKASFSNFKVSDAAGDVPATQSTNGTLCFGDAGVVVTFNASDAFIFSPYTKCDSTTWVASDTVEVFIAPVRAVTDNPQFYYELDAVPSGVMYGGLVNNSKGNASTCIGESGCKTPGPLPCTGAAEFAHKMTITASNATRSWSVSYFIPWAVFAPEFRPQNALPWHLWRVNFYRYSYPHGPNENFDNFELNAWSATHTPSFHEPSRFGVVVME